MYIPQPRDTSGVILPREIQALIEEIACNTHDVWAKNRMEAGWTYGPARDDAALKHPCLLPYDQLPEEEKLYDRQTASEVIKLILSLGYKISRD